MKTSESLIGHRFGNLVVHNTFLKEYNGKLRKVAECLCDCGNSTVVLVYSLYRKSKPTRSCGCLIRKKASLKKSSPSIYSHPLRKVYDSMLSRCYKPEHKSYCNYGARGIEVCDEWKHDYENFYQWAIGAGWSKGLQLDRQDNSGNYSPSNCRFVSPLDNNINKRDNILVEAFGEVKPLAHWERGRDPRSKVKLNALQHRLHIGWSPEDAITTPPRSNHSSNHSRFNYKAFGEIKTAEEWDNDPRCQVAKTTFIKRIAKGWTVEDAITTPPNQLPKKKKL